MVTVKWHNSNITRLKALGYKFTHFGDEVQIKAKDLSEYSRTAVSVKCDYCYKEYSTLYGTVARAVARGEKCACSNCAPKKANELRNERQSNLYKKQLDSICNKKGYKLLLPTNCTLKSSTTISYVCPIHGVRNITVDNMIHEHGCYYCGRKSVGDKLRLSSDQVKKTVDSINGNTLLNPDDYTGTHVRNLRIRCSCGNEFYTSFYNYTKKGVNKCKSCSMANSRGEKLISDCLNSISIPFIREYKFDDCRDKRKLPFDFYLPNENKIIEFDGMQHFEEVNNRNHAMTVKHDTIKNNYCKEHNIPILRIPYWEGSNIEQLVKDFIYG